MNLKTNRLKICLLLALVLCLAACTDDDLHKVAKGLVVAGATVGDVQSIVIEAQKQNLISEESTGKFLDVCLKVNTASKESVQATRGLAKLDSANRTALLTVLQPVIEAVTTSIHNDLLGISDQATRDKIELALVSLLTTLNTLQATLQGGN